MVKYLALLVFTTFSLTGCGTVVNGTKQALKVDTYPPGLKANVDDKECVTPCTLENISRKARKITITSNAGEKFFFDLDDKVNIGSAIFGNWWTYVGIGFAFDAATGGAWTIQDVNLRIDKLAAEYEKEKQAKIQEVQQAPVQQPVEVIKTN